MKTVRFIVTEQEHQCVNVEVIVQDTIICTLHLAPSEAMDLVNALAVSLEKGKRINIETYCRLLVLGNEENQ